MPGIFFSTAVTTSATLAGHGPAPFWFLASITPRGSFNFAISPEFMGVRQASTPATNRYSIFGVTVGHAPAASRAMLSARRTVIEGIGPCRGKHPPAARSPRAQQAKAAPLRIVCRDCLMGSPCRGSRPRLDHQEGRSGNPVLLPPVADQNV